ncbi:MAG: hypothetical protein M0P47_09170 [Bacteroidales bacterium]|nr:hypothetical protein [Bacteroidales bacterium]
MTIDHFIEGASSVDMGQIINRAVEKKEKVLVYMNWKDQLYEQGIDSEGRQLPPYKKSTQRIKKAKSQRYDHTTLRDTGEFEGNFIIIYRPNEIEFSARPTYRDGMDLTLHLQDRYGTDIFGLTQPNIEKLQEIIKDDIIEELRQWA